MFFLAWESKKPKQKRDDKIVLSNIVTFKPEMTIDMLKGITEKIQFGEIRQI